MRFHRDWELGALWAKRRNRAELLDPLNLALARIEPVMRNERPAIILDLRFERDDRCLHVPFIVIDELALLTKLRDVLIWPEAIANFCGDLRLAAVEKAVASWLEYALVARGCETERYHLFREGKTAEVFAAARTAKLFGAASLRETAHAFAFAQYAARFAAGATICATAEYLNEAALLTPFAGEVIVTGMQSGDRSTAQAWFGEDIAPTFAHARAASLYLGQPAKSGDAHARIIERATPGKPTRITYAEPAPLDDLIRFGEQDGRDFGLAVTAIESAAVDYLAPAPSAAGNSSGMVVFMLRPDAFEAPGADVEEVHALSELLRAEGFGVSICTEFEPETLRGAGIIHAYGLHAPHAIDLALAMAKERGIPFVLSPLFEDASAGGRWAATASRSLLGALDDDGVLERTLVSLAERQVEVDGMSAHMRVDDGFDNVRRELLRRADVVAVSGTVEREAVQKFSGRRRRITETPAVMYRGIAHAPVAHLVPDIPFVLVHATMEARYNLGLTIRALRSLDLPTVCIAPPVDRRLTRNLHASGGAKIAFLPEVSAGECEAIYARAAVFADTAFFAEGGHRVMRAIAQGQVAVLSAGRPIADFAEPYVQRVDPASYADLSAGLAAAWQRAGGDDKSTRLAPIATPGDALRTYVQVYAQAAQYLHTHSAGV